jgi:predicted TIM-barrel fold metal-dependent hydrolase
MRTITLEEHFTHPGFMDGPGQAMRAQVAAAQDHPLVAAGFTRLIEQLGDVGEQRLAAMDADGIDLQVLSLTSPGAEQLDAPAAVALAGEANDFVAEAVRRHPTRFAALAALPLADPAAAVVELEQRMGQGFKGVVINGHARGRYLDDPFFGPILERAAALHAPIYLHPTPPPAAVIQASYAGSYGPQITALLASAAWGWHIETANHLLRVILSGAFDRYTGLQFILGHLGETLPFMLPRLDLGLPMPVTHLARPISAYLRENVHYTISGFNWTPAFLDLLMQVGVERIMFSADYPYASMAQAKGFLEQLPLSPADRERIAHGNAERLLGL